MPRLYTSAIAPEEILQLVKDTVAMGLAWGRPPEEIASNAAEAVWKRLAIIGKSPCLTSTECLRHFAEDAAKESRGYRLAILNGVRQRLTRRGLPPDGLDEVLEVVKAALDQVLEGALLVNRYDVEQMGRETKRR